MRRDPRDRRGAQGSRGGGRGGGGGGRGSGARPSAPLPKKVVKKKFAGKKKPGGGKDRDKMKQFTKDELDAQMERYDETFVGAQLSPG